MKALQKLIAQIALEEVIKAAPVRKESGTTPSEAVVEPDQEEVKPVKSKTKKQAAAAVATAARRVQKQAADTERAQVFVRAYVENGFNSTAAYKKLKPNVKATTARTEGCKFLGRPNVQQILSSYLIKLRERYEIDHQFVWRAWLRSSLANPVEYFESVNGGIRLRDLTEMPVDLQRNLKKVKITRTSIPMEDGPPMEKEVVEIEVVDQQKAIDSMARALQMFEGDASGGGENAIADLIRQGTARIKALGDLNAHRIESKH